MHAQALPCGTTAPRGTQAAAWVPCELACSRRPCCAAARAPRATLAAGWVPCELACTCRFCCAPPWSPRAALAAA